MPAVRSDLNGGLLTCLCFIMYQEYTVICIFDQMHVNLIWYLYPFMLNKICLSLSLRCEEVQEYYYLSYFTGWHCNGIEDLYWESYFRCCILSLCVCWLAAMIARYYRFEQQANRMYLIGIDWIIDIIALDHTTGHQEHWGISGYLSLTP